jgi:hypothetical protein
MDPQIAQIAQIARTLGDGRADHEWAANRADPEGNRECANAGRHL